MYFDFDSTCIKNNKYYCSSNPQASTSNQDSQDLPDSTESEDKNNHNAKANAEEMDFDIDDIDKELEMALERKRVWLISVLDYNMSRLMRKPTTGLYKHRRLLEAGNFGSRK